MIRVAIVDDHRILRKGVKQFLAEQVDLRVCGEAANGREALELVRELEIDVLILDLCMPEHGGVDALSAIKARKPGLPVLILSALPETQFASALLRQGAGAYLNKDCDPDDIVKAVRALALGKRFITPAVAELLVDGLDARGGKPRHELLSVREFQVFLRLAQGESVGGVAEHMFLSAKTISTYRSRVLSKLGLASNSDLTYYALKHGLIQ